MRGAAAARFPSCIPAIIEAYSFYLFHNKPRIWKKQRPSAGCILRKIENSLAKPIGNFVLEVLRAIVDLYYSQISNPAVAKCLSNVKTWRISRFRIRAKDK